MAETSARLTSRTGRARGTRRGIKRDPGEGARGDKRASHQEAEPRGPAPHHQEREERCGSQLGGWPGKSQRPAQDAPQLERMPQPAESPEPHVPPPPTDTACRHPPHRGLVLSPGGPTLGPPLGPPPIFRPTSSSAGPTVGHPRPAPSLAPHLPPSGPSWGTQFTNILHPRRWTQPRRTPGTTWPPRSATRTSGPQPSWAPRPWTNTSHPPPPHLAPLLALLRNGGDLRRAAAHSSQHTATPPGAPHPGTPPRAPPAAAATPSPEQAPDRVHAHRTAQSQQPALPETLGLSWALAVWDALSSDLHVPRSPRSLSSATPLPSVWAGAGHTRAVTRRGAGSH